MGLSPNVWEECKEKVFLFQNSSLIQCLSTHHKAMKRKQTDNISSSTLARTLAPPAYNGNLSYTPSKELKSITRNVGRGLRWSGRIERVADGLMVAAGLQSMFVIHSNVCSHDVSSTSAHAFTPTQRSSPESNPWQSTQFRHELENPLPYWLMVFV